MRWRWKVRIAKANACIDRLIDWYFNKHNDSPGYAVFWPLLWIVVIGIMVLAMVPS